jgi:hypothetical protein
MRLCLFRENRPFPVPQLCRRESAAVIAAGAAASSLYRMLTKVRLGESNVFCISVRDTFVLLFERIARAISPT